MPHAARMSAKVALLGPSGVGKTALYNRLIYQEWHDSMAMVPTIGAYVGIYLQKNIDISLWDTAGNIRYAGLTLFYLKDAQLIMLVMDPLSDNFAAELSALRFQVDTLNQYEPQPRYLLVATKSDLIVTDEQQALAQENRKKFSDAFSQIGSGVALPFTATIAGMESSLKATVFETLNSIHNSVNTNAANEEKKMDSSITVRLDRVKTKIEKRFIKPDASRIQSIDRLKANLLECQTREDMQEVLIKEARFIRTPDENGKLRYGVNLGSSHFKFFVHFRSYEHSSLYQFIKSELAKIDSTIDLAALSAPERVKRPPRLQI